MQNPEIVIIGAGLGGLTCGAFLARAGLKVCILEQHSKIGGYAHTFRRGIPGKNGPTENYTFDIGIHSVPLSPDGMILNLLRQLDCDISTLEIIEQEEMFRCITPSFTFTVPSNADSANEQLIRHFASEKSVINTFIASARNIFTQFSESILENSTIYGPDSPMAIFLGVSYQKLLKAFFSNIQLQKLMGSIWPCIGVSPAKASSAPSFMMFASHLFEGSHHCKNNFSAIAELLSSCIIANGGQILTSSKVIALGVENKRVTFAQLENGQIIEASSFISNISPYQLYNYLIPATSRSKLVINRLQQLHPSVSVAAVYLGMQPSFREIVQGNIINWFSSDNYEEIYNSIKSGKGWKPDQMMLMPRFSEEYFKNTLTLLSLVDGNKAALADIDKKQIEHEMITCAENIYPGISKCINTSETATPSTFERYTGNTCGALYGFENICDRYCEARMPQKYPLNNLYNTGHWGLSGGGVWNVIVNGFRTSIVVIKEAEKTLCA
jgi:prolycopene isomerase